MTITTKHPSPALTFRSRSLPAGAARGLLAGLCGLAATLSPAGAAIIYATGQNNGDASHANGNYYYSIDTTTGKATPISPLLPALGVTGLATVGTQLVGFKDGSHGTIDLATGTFTPIAASNGFTIGGYEVFNGFGYGVPSAGTDRRLQRIDLTTNAATGIGTGNPIGSAMDSFYGNVAGTNNPFIISLGSVGNTIYGVNSATGKNNLVALDPVTGNATILGTANAVATSGIPGASYSGFSALTGADENGDGVYDTLYGNINFFDPDGLSGSTPEVRYGGLVRYDLNNGTWNLVGSNTGLIFFGFASPVPVPEPGSAALTALGLAAALRRRCRK